LRRYLPVAAGLVESLRASEASLTDRCERAEATAHAATETAASAASAAGWTHPLALINHNPAPHSTS